MKRKQSQVSSGLSRRLHFPADEKRLPWLPALLDAYAIADTGVAIAVRDAEKKQGKRLACAAGCDVCCHQPDIPIYPHELVGIYWYAAEKLSPDVREAVRTALANHVCGAACPFLVDSACAIHAVRPVSCRQFNVFTRACAPGEDPYYTRREDVLVPLTDYTDRAFAAVLAFYGLKGGGDAAASVRAVRSRIVNLQEFDWKKLAGMLEQAVAGNRQEPERSS